MRQISASRQYYCNTKKLRLLHVHERQINSCNEKSTSNSKKNCAIETFQGERPTIEFTSVVLLSYFFRNNRLLAAYCWLYSHPICLPTKRMCALMLGQFFVQPNTLMAILHLEQRRHWWQTEFVSNLPITLFTPYYLYYLDYSKFCLFGVNVLGSRCSLFSRFSLFDFPGLCFKVEKIKSFSRPSIVMMFGLFWVCLSTRRAEKNNWH